MTEGTIAIKVRYMTIESIRAFAKAIAYWCARAFQLQLFLTLVSLPILVAWGLPISCMSPLGNCLFTPFLTLFLLLSSLMFFGQLLHIPYSPLVYLFNYLTRFWIDVMNYGQMQWLVGIVCLPMPFLLLIGITPFCIIAYKPTRSVGHSILCFLCILSIVYAYSRYISNQIHRIAIPCGRGELTLLITPSATILIDPGYLGSKVAASSWVRYTLIPVLISTTGTTHINHVIMLQPMGLGFEAAAELCTSIRVDALYIPCWQGELKRSHTFRYAELKKSLVSNFVQLVRIDSTPTIILLSDRQRVTVTPQEKQISLGDIRFQSQKLQVQIDNKEVTIYSAKYVIPEVKKQLQEKNPTKK